MRRIFLLTIAIIFCFGSAALADIFGKPFSDGSPSCTTCHSVAAAGYTVSAWGPDISSFYDDLGGDASAIADFIRASGIGPMDAAYAESMITDEEIAKLAKAYAGLKPEEASVTSGSSVVVYAFLLFVVLLAAGRVAFKNNSQLEENK